MHIDSENVVNSQTILILPFCFKVQNTHRFHRFSQGTYFFRDSIKRPHFFNIQGKFQTL